MTRDQYAERAARYAEQGSRKLSDLYSLRAAGVPLGDALKQVRARFATA